MFENKQRLAKYAYGHCLCTCHVHRNWLW